MQNQNAELFPITKWPTFVFSVPGTDPSGSKFHTCKPLVQREVLRKSRVWNLMPRCILRAKCGHDMRNNLYPLRFSNKKTIRDWRYDFQEMSEAGLNWYSLAMVGFVSRMTSICERENARAAWTCCQRSFSWDTSDLRSFEFRKTQKKKGKKTNKKGKGKKTKWRTQTFIDKKDRFHF